MFYSVRLICCFTFCHFLPTVAVLSQTLSSINTFKMTRHATHSPTHDRGDLVFGFCQQIWGECSNHLLQPVPRPDQNKHQCQFLHCRPHWCCWSRSRKEIMMYHIHIEHLHAALCCWSGAVRRSVMVNKSDLKHSKIPQSEQKNNPLTNMLCMCVCPSGWRKTTQLAFSCFCCRVQMKYFLPFFL